MRTTTVTTLVFSALLSISSASPASGHQQGTLNARDVPAPDAAAWWPLKPAPSKTTTHTSTHTSTTTKTSAKTSSSTQASSKAVSFAAPISSSIVSSASTSSAFSTSPSSTVVFTSVTLNLTTTNSAPTPSPTAIEYNGDKFAVVHHIVGNTYTYRLVDWMTDLSLIEEAGFDAIALNTGPDCWQLNSVDLAYKAAAALNSKVKLFWSFDMSVFPQAGAADAATIASYINKYATNPYTFTMGGKPFVSTFSGDQWASAFGSTMCGGWNMVRADVPTDFFFVPAWFFPSGLTIADVRDCVEGLFQWNSAWSLDGAPVSAAPDLDWATQLGPNKTYMAGVSPTFFTHYPVDGLNKNWVYASDNNYATRWQQVAQVNAPMVQVITWNDFGESHYIGPRPSSVQLQPTNTTWVNGNNHLPWARITKPYVQAYKNGAPAALGSDLIIWEYRTHPANATATVDAVGPPQGSNLVHDNIYITAYLSAPAEVRVTVGSRSGSFQASAGLNHFAQPFESGYVTVGMWRDGQNVGGTLTGERAIVAQPEFYDFNPVVEQFWHDPQWEACAH